MGRIVPFSELQGKKYGRLTVIAEAGRSRARSRQFLCHCECGNEKIVTYGNLNAGHIRSCGCWQIEVARETQKKYNPHKTHGLTGSPEYKSWSSMKDRCVNPNNKSYKNYGARGIKVCERWRGEENFPNFLEDMGERPAPKKNYSLERLDVNGDYCKENCVWATTKEQTRNTRSNIFVDGLCLKDYCQLHGLNYQTVQTRRNRGWSLHDALTTPVRR